MPARGLPAVSFVRSIESNPIARLIPDPAAALKAECLYETTIAASWRATVAVA